MSTLLSFISLAVLPRAALSAEEDPPRPPPAAARPVDFVRDVQPIFARSCVSCHGPRRQKGGLRLDQKAAALQGGERGPAIRPRKSEESLLVRFVSGLDEKIRMPPSGRPLTAEQVEVLRSWIDEGAQWPAEADAKKGEETSWFLLPLRKPPLPSVRDETWIHTPVDAFILARLEASGLAPSPTADRRTLIRRLTFDLTGLPPAPEEVEAFLADEDPEAYEEVVDRLLSSPRYGERWARHWMDVVHYAETHGHDEDKPRPNAWPYRDYLIGSFNADKPYARFVEEQISGDVLYPEDSQALVATAFLAVGPWDQSSQMGIQDGTLDKQVARYLDRDDMIATAMSTFVSSTVHCARCHDHKFDPISQEDYYALQAVFAGVDRVDRAYDSDPQVHAARRALLKRKAELEGGLETWASSIGAASEERVAAWEKEHGAAATAWSVLRPVTCASAGGSTLAKLPDGSVLVSGSRPEKDTYTITASSDLKGITAIRLEVMADESLPHRGPGRQDNGNLHLSELKLSAAPLRDTAAARQVAFRSASADFDQEGWGVARGIDGQPETGWGIYPQVGRSHAAVFVLREPIAFEGGALLTFSLEQLHGGGHLIGRPRLSITTAASPPPLTAIPDAIAAILAQPAGGRSDRQRSELARYVLRQDVERELAALPAPELVYSVASDFEPKGNFKPAKKPRPVEVLRRGDIRQPQGAAAPGALSCVAGLEARFRIADPEDEGCRRAALARWIAHKGNALTWRSIANRIWHYHFGRGIVDTPNDLGRMGGSPTHPELLDWLATTFRDDLRGSLKALHRLIVTSNAYRQSSRSNERAALVDAENRLLWRMNRTRLDAEEVRDAVLAVSGKIDWTMGGPSVKQFLETKGVHETPNLDYSAFDVDSPASFRRSVYRFVFRTIPDPLMQALDCPDASQWAPVRQSSVTALQALAMLNDRFIVRQSEHLAARLAVISSDPPEQIKALYALALGRPPQPEETADLCVYAAKHGMANACRMVLNSNEFMFVP